ncbi:ribonuclease III [Dinoroseobacter phage vB_DshS-R4C]|uniref:Ribonuclease III n=1 Tax=Dinoroseobacter phage vB_DshS-R4C TaxID=2590919 RepID=A0ACD6BAB8_9CAUD|nr:Chain S, Ribonuclease III [Dinoroseobacter phage vB_DshS-R4C]8GTC_T Chain T, Ribonuclease III [Dinoroseobacter phage vB_DshS-R4C]8GTC_U Chain U, Ribonuclease III [Dinoroseobacter phage vB_DshS-R4C]8GTC_V Chain V, Ribonuclease III [Dinoroseobacter phage vB_DshS-R4C]8GTC_W Chain W, Ribonuclease III [Dinoroseobacter phage vB_DshS-R4C]8GTC_X Chain X, Ribonuclease III [Dinoroseobacter phage vB_DshS-R4C]8GTC_Y Chain Y, Ribonuclease III [Dinoroseobacter phage vB_DshS-R4C]8GTC_Z Chain Z, Ribonucl
MPTPFLALPLIAEGQAGQHVTHNEALDMIDALAPRVVLSDSLATPPPAPPDRSAWIVPPGGSGFGGAGPGQIALRLGGVWHAITPAQGARWRVLDRGAAVIWSGTSWRPADVSGALGSTLGLATIEATVTATGPSVTAPALIPPRAIVLGVTSWTVQAVTGATSYRVGVPGEPDKFGASLGAAPGSSNIGVVGPFATYAPTDVVVTAEGADFTGGTIGLAASVILPGAPV